MSAGRSVSAAMDASSRTLPAGSAGWRLISHSLLVRVVALEAGLVDRRSNQECTRLRRDDLAGERLEIGRAGARTRPGPCRTVVRDADPVAFGPDLDLQADIAVGAVGDREAARFDDRRCQFRRPRLRRARRRRRGRGRRRRAPSRRPASSGPSSSGWSAGRRLRRRRHRRPRCPTRSPIRRRLQRRGRRRAVRRGLRSSDRRGRGIAGSRRNDAGLAALLVLHDRGDLLDRGEPAADLVDCHLHQRPRPWRRASRQELQLRRAVVQQALELVGAADDLIDADAAAVAAVATVRTAEAAARRRAGERAPDRRRPRVVDRRGRGALVADPRAPTAARSPASSVDASTRARCRAWSAA